MGGQIPVTEAEPDLTTETLERLHDGPGLAGQSPAAFVIVHAGQGVGHGVQVGTDHQAVQDGVVPGVHHGGDLGRRYDADKPAQEAGGTHSSGEGGDHRARLMARRGAETRVPVCKAPPGVAG